MTAWRDSQGDIWTEGDDGLMHTPDTQPATRERVERKWGPLEPVPDLIDGDTIPAHAHPNNTTTPTKENNMTTVNLTKARSVLDLDGAFDTSPTFTSRDEDNGLIRRGLSMSEQDYNDMGRPERVTVTIEPGDRLNAQELHDGDIITKVHHALAESVRIDVGEDCDDYATDLITAMQNAGIFFRTRR
ncbi:MULTISPECIES: hypothetical protein [unclassified Aeromicrobium]|uniref:hypothetical protein n=1 Tax=unclassified Aeromicrobium TaxID=2633570 RepID=UPI00288B1157|nr:MULTISPECIES: hypothetical protein [unclassified Aeromicrobium]